MLPRIVINDTREFHRNQKIGDMNHEVTFALEFTTHFDQAENGCSYGINLARKLLENLNDTKINILDIGPGNGEPSYDFLYEVAFVLKNAKQEFGLDYRIDYHAVEISDALMQNSVIRELNLENLSVMYINADAHNLPFKKKSFDFIISNEMIGDMLTASSDELFVKDFYKKNNFYLDSEIVNIGALMLMQQSYDMLNDGGMLFISEHSSERPLIIKLNGRKASLVRENSNPAPLPIGSGDQAHIEYNVKFSDLEKYANHLGFECERGKLVDIAKIREDSIIIDQKHLLRLMKHKDIRECFLKVHPDGIVPKSGLLWHLKYHIELLEKIFNKAELDYCTSNAIKTKDYYNNFEYLILKK